MGINTAADLAAGAVAMVAKARYTYEHKTVMANLATPMRLEPGEKSKYIPKFGGATAYDLTDGVDMSSQETLSITGTTHTTDEAGCKVVITRKLRNNLKEDAFQAAGKVIGNAMGKKIDRDGLTLFSGINSGLGSGSTTFSLDYLIAARTQCAAQAEPVPEPIYVVLHPNTAHVLVDLLSMPSTAHFPDELSKSLLYNYWRGNEKLWNMPIFTDGNLVPDSSDYCYSGAFSAEAFVYLVGWEPENWLEEDKSLRGWEIGIVADYAMVEEDGTYGRYLYFTAAAITS